MVFKWMSLSASNSSRAATNGLFFKTIDQPVLIKSLIQPIIHLLSRLATFFFFFWSGLVSMEIIETVGFSLSKAKYKKEGGKKPSKSFHFQKMGAELI